MNPNEKKEDSRLFSRCDFETKNAAKAYAKKIGRDVSFVLRELLIRELEAKILLSEMPSHPFGDHRND